MDLEETIFSQRKHIILHHNRHCLVCFVHRQNRLPHLGVIVNDIVTVVVHPFIHFFEHLFNLSWFLVVQGPKLTTTIGVPLLNNMLTWTNTSTTRPSH
jgi:hypothetical protein